MYYKRNIDTELISWSKRTDHKPLLLRGARQVGKSTAVKNLGKKFDSYVEVNFERNPEYKTLFSVNLDVKRIVSQISVMCGTSIIAGKTLVFFDEIQECHEAIMALRFFREEMPELHVIAAGSLLEFALDELPTFGVGRIHSLYMYPMTFDEFLIANNEQLLLDARNQASPQAPLPLPLHDKIVELFRTYMIVGGMPEVVAAWVESKDFIRCQELQDDIISGYEDDFPKYRKKVNTDLLRKTLRSVACQVTKKFVFSEVDGNYKANEVRNALDMLHKAGLVIPVTHTNANGLPLGSESDTRYRKMLLFDSGLEMRLLNMTLGNVTEITTHILTTSVADLINKGPMAEMIAGLEIMRYQSSKVRCEMYYWTRQSRGAQAEIDYIINKKSKIIPVEVKAGQQGGMKSLWSFMREKTLTDGIRCSLENFGEFEYVDKEADMAVRHVEVCPIYALSQLMSHT